MTQRAPAKVGDRLEEVDTPALILDLHVSDGIDYQYDITFTFPGWRGSPTHSPAIGRWLDDLPKPVGVMACNDMRGQHVLDACRRHELAVPEDEVIATLRTAEALDPKA